MGEHQQLQNISYIGADIDVAQKPEWLRDNEFFRKKRPNWIAVHSVRFSLGHAAMRRLHASVPFAQDRACHRI
jgi:hypothetical protein